MGACACEIDDRVRRRIRYGSLDARDIVLVRMHDHDKVKIDEGLLQVVLHGSMCL
jgi:hypothetical protein